MLSQSNASGIALARLGGLCVLAWVFYYMAFAQRKRLVTPQSLRRLEWYKEIAVAENPGWASSMLVMYHAVQSNLPTRRVALVPNQVIQPQ